MSNRAPIEYTDIRRVEGPLLVAAGIDGVGWDEDAEIVLEGDEVRHGVVLERDRDLAVIQVLEGTSGIATTGTAVRFSGHPMRIGVGEAWLGRGAAAGAPRSTGPADPRRHIRRCERRSAQPDRPRHSERRDPHWHLGRSTRSPHSCAARSSRSSRWGGCRTSSSQPRSPRRPTPVANRSQSSSPGWGSHTRRGRGARHPRGALRVRGATLLLNTADDPVIERIITPRVALTVAEHLAFDDRSTRARRDGRHDRLLRGRPSGVRRSRRDARPARLSRLPLQRPRLDLRTLRPRPWPQRVDHRSSGAHHARWRSHPSRSRPDRVHHRGTAPALGRAAQRAASIHRSNRSGPCPA